jgi:integrin beta 1
MAQFSFLLLIFTSIIVVCSSQLSAAFNCTAQKKCGACAAVSPQCHWCTDENFEGERCNHLAILNQTSCKDIVNPRSSITFKEDEAPRNARGPTSPPVLLAPQKINITLRPNEPFEFNMVFRQAENYPVDIYFLMDVSFTMKAYKDTLSRLTDQLVDGVRSITTDYRLGFGSFVDKTVLPFVLTGLNNQIVDQCNANDNCVLPYGFRNQLNLTQNESEFKVI